MVKTTEVKEEKIFSLNRIIAEVNKKANKQIIGTTSEMTQLSVKRLPTGITELDTALGGGFPAGRIVELYGLPGVGKSLISLLAIKKAQDEGKECIYIDSEDTFDVEWAKKWGINTDKLIIAPVSVTEDMFELLFKLVKAKPTIVVIDSIASLTTRLELEENIDRQFMAPKARLFSKALPILNTLNSETCFIFLNQLRETLALYGPKFNTPSGQAIKFYSSIRLEVKKVEDLHEDNMKTHPIEGQVVGFKVTKNKTSQPFKTGSFKLFFDGRIE